MIFPDKKKAVTVILSRFGKDGSSKEMPVKPEEGEASPVKGIAEDMMQALHDKSVMGLEGALSALISHIQVMDEEQDAEPEDQDE